MESQNGSDSDESSQNKFLLKFKTPKNSEKNNESSVEVTFYGRFSYVHHHLGANLYPIYILIFLGCCTLFPLRPIAVYNFFSSIMGVFLLSNQFQVVFLCHEKTQLSGSVYVVNRLISKHLTLLFLKFVFYIQSPLSLFSQVRFIISYYIIIF